MWGGRGPPGLEDSPWACATRLYSTLVKLFDRGSFCCTLTNIRGKTSRHLIPTNLSCVWQPEASSLILILSLEVGKGWVELI